MMVRFDVWRLLGLGLLVVAGSGTMAQTSVKVSGFQVTGNTLLKQAAVDGVLLPMIGQRTIDDLRRAAAAVQALYAAEGYGAVVAYVPPQSGQDGIVTIAVVEGKIASVKVSGAKRLGEQRVKDTLPALVTGETPRISHIDAQLRMANENPSRQLQLLLQPGQKPGEAEARIAVDEQPVQRVTVGLDNTGNTRTGDYRASLGWQHADLTGRDDVLSAQLQTSPTDPKLVKVFSGGYRLPLYRQRMALDVFAGYSDVEGGATQTIAGDLNFNGRGRVLGTRAGWYLSRWGEFDQRVAIGLDHRAYLNRCTIGGLGSSVCGPAGESVTVHPLSLEYSAQAGGPTSLGLSVSLNGNLKLGGQNTSAARFEAVRPGAKPSYVALRFGASGATVVAEDWSLRGRLTGQLTRDGLVPGEQFGIGGASSVRGYEERELVGDNGAFASFELASPSLLSQTTAGRLSLQAFVDAAYVANQLDTPCLEDRTRCTLASLGVGARFGLGTLQARLDVAYALKAAARTQRGDAKAHFAVNYGF